MAQALRVVMTVYGVIGVLFGLAFIFIPQQLGNMLGYAEGPRYVPYFLASLGSCFIAASVFIIAAARNPLGNILWVKFAILLSILSVVTGLYSLLRGFVDFGQAGLGIIIDAVFAVLFLALYPWRAAAR